MVLFFISPDSSFWHSARDMGGGSLCAELQVCVGLHGAIRLHFDQSPPIMSLCSWQSLQLESKQRAKRRECLRIKHALKPLHEHHAALTHHRRAIPLLHECRCTEYQHCCSKGQTSTLLGPLVWKLAPSLLHKLKVSGKIADARNKLHF